MSQRPHDLAYPEATSAAHASSRQDPTCTSPSSASLTTSHSAEQSDPVNSNQVSSDPVSNGTSSVAQDPSVVSTKSVSIHDSRVDLWQHPEKDQPSYTLMQPWMEGEVSNHLPHQFLQESMQFGAGLAPTAISTKVTLLCGPFGEGSVKPRSGSDDDDDDDNKQN